MEDFTREKKYLLEFNVAEEVHVKTKRGLLVNVLPKDGRLEETVLLEGIKNISVKII